MARYRDIADDLRARIVTGEWRPGDRIPTQAALCEFYAVADVNTIRDAQRILRGEGLLQSNHGGGIYVIAVPHATRVEPDPTTVRDELVAIQHATNRALAQLPADVPPTPYIVDTERRARPLSEFLDEQTTIYPGRTWLAMTGYRCRTCGAEGRRDRGWLEPAIDDHPGPADKDVRADSAASDPGEAPCPSRHRIKRWHGPDPDEAKKVATLDELFAERDANAHEAARLLTLHHPDPRTLIGYLVAARWHAARVAEITKKMSTL